MNQVVQLPNSAVRTYSAGQLDLIRRTVAADTNPSEFDLFVEVCKRAGLDPFRRQIHAVVYSKDNPQKRKMSIITGVDGFRAVAARNRDYRPDDNEPEYTIDPALKSDTNPLGLVKAVVHAYKLAPNGEWHRVTGVAYWDEFAPVKEAWDYSQEQGKRVPSGRFELDRGGNWYRMGRVMLAKCAEVQALRKGWPEDLSGIYAAEEMEQAAVYDSASEALAAYDRDERMKLVGGRDSLAIVWHPGAPIEMVQVGTFMDDCIRWMNEAKTADEINAFAETNAASLRQFWGHHKSDALDLKKRLETRRAQLSAITPSGFHFVDAYGDRQTAEPEASGEFLDRMVNALSEASVAGQVDALLNNNSEALARVEDAGRATIDGLAERTRAALRGTLV